MPDRFDKTAADARAAIEEAAERAAAARARRQELEERLAALRGPRYLYGPDRVTFRVSAARERLASARASSERARDRAAQAMTRARAGRD